MGVVTLISTKLAGSFGKLQSIKVAWIRGQTTAINQSPGRVGVSVHTSVRRLRSRQACSRSAGTEGVLPWYATKLLNPPTTLKL